MGERIQIPAIPEEARTPLVQGLLELIEQLVQRVRQQGEKIAQLEDEIAVLKGEKKRSRFKPSQLDKKAGREEGALGECATRRESGMSERRKSVAPLPIWVGDELLGRSAYRMQGKGEIAAPERYW
jgi:hypothetical protein